MSDAGATAPGWYVVAQNTQRWWDGHRWAEDVVHHGGRTTATAVRRSATRMQWVMVGFGVIAWAVFLALSFSGGISAAFTLAVLPVVASAMIVIGAIRGSRLIVALPPTPQVPPNAFGYSPAP